METLKPTPLTAQEFAVLPEPPDGSKQELVRGEVVTMPPPGFRHGRCQIKVGVHLELFARSTNLGRVTVESGVVTENGPDSVRGPDIAYWTFERLPADQEPVVYANVAPDLVVEVLSPSDKQKNWTKKVREYFASGVRMVWVVDPESRTVGVFRKPGEGRILWEDAELSGEEVLPGFNCKVADFFG